MILTKSWGSTMFANLSKEKIRSLRTELLDDTMEAMTDEMLEPKLAIIRANLDDAASEIYIRNKVKTCESIGIECEVYSDCYSKEETISLIDTLAERKDISGIIVQLPLPERFDNKGDKRDILDHIPWYKDVDGLSTESVGRLWTGEECIAPATACAVAELILSVCSYTTCGKKVSIINRSDLIGKPLAKLLLDRNMTVEILHSHSNRADIRRAFDMSDFVVTGVGNTDLVDYFYDQTIWIDCGIIRDAEGHVHGDAGALKSSKITPVPYGVGTLTTAHLACNVVDAACIQKSLGII